MPVDLHVHTTFSDGTWTPGQVVAHAKANQVDLLALTDHDTMGGVQEVRTQVAASTIRIIPGVEFNTDVNEHEIDILGYFHDMPIDPEFHAIMLQRSRARIDRALSLIAKLKGLGIVVSYDRVREIAAGVVARPHVAQAMIENGYVSSQKEAYERYIGLGAPAFVPHDPFHPIAAIAAIHRAGGVAVAAHPGLIGDDSLLNELIAAGLDGLEAFYPEHSPEKVAHYRDMAHRNRLLVTAGSDCHGPGRKKSYPLGCMDLPDSERATFCSKLETAWAKATH
jgi:3',5'-nucleoside bisphosphate phosphatase